MSKRLNAILLTLLFAILAWFQYRTVDGVLAIVLLDILLGLVLLLSLIPIIGWIGNLYIGWYHIIPWVLEFTGVQYSWIITLLFGIYTILGLIITIIILIMLIAWVRK